MLSLRKTLTAATRLGKNLLEIRCKHTLPALPYEYNALEPIICCEIMHIHHTKHHAAYVNGLNDAEDKIKTAVLKNDFAEIIKLGDVVKFHGGGHINHTLFWENMSPCGGEPSKELKKAIDENFGNLDKLREQISLLAVGVQGSGWAWLGVDPKSKKLQVAKCANQDPLQATTGLVPLLGIDVWEHAYYLQYKNVRNEYVKNFWEIINWKVVSERFANATKS